MKALKYLFGLFLLLAVVAGCKKDKFGDTSFVTGAAAPDKVAALFDITQDNTGRVTITPNGEGGTSYDVYFGDATTDPAKVAPGKSIQHTYAEGVYNVKIIAYSLGGKTTEVSKQLTVSFKAPEDLEVTATVDVANNYKLNVSAKAKYETVFKVYFGDVADEVPVSFSEGETISHTYLATGTYTLKVVALSGGVAVTEFTKIIEIVDPVLLPLDFESPTVTYSFINFGGGDVTVIDNPQKNGINTSNKIGKMVKNAPEVYGGSLIVLGNPINFSANKFFSMKVFSPRVGAKVLLKVENLTDGSINFEKEVATTVANKWEDLGFDFTAINVANSYQKIVLIFDLGTVGDGSANFTYLFDDIKQTNSLPSNKVVLPLTFDNPALTYTFTNFGDAFSSVVINPHVDGNNGSASVGKLNKISGAQVWAGSFIELGDPINFSSLKKIKMKVWSPKAGITVKMKLENLADNTINTEVDAVNTVANGWEDLVFDFSTANNANKYQRLVVFFDFGNAGTGADYFFDEIELTTGAEEVVLPLTFQSSTLTYTFIGFGDASTEVINNPDPSGINTSSKVAALTKPNGSQVWAGSFIELAKPADFSSLKKIKIKVWSPKAGITVKFKMENLLDNTINTELDATTTKANQWEELTYDFNGIDNAKKYQRMVVFFDFGNAGTGATYYFDDIKLN